MPVSSSEQRLLGRIGGYKSWANTEDRTARTAPGRKAFLSRLADAPDPEAAKRAYFAELSVKAQRAKNAARVKKARFNAERGAPDRRPASRITIDDDRSAITTTAELWEEMQRSYLRGDHEAAAQFEVRARRAELVAEERRLVPVLSKPTLGALRRKRAT